jgi:DNA-directed RNA polymerase subunit RPC12/RpoP
MGKGLGYSRTKEPGFPFDRTLEPLPKESKSRFPINGKDQRCSFICHKCQKQILADPRDVPTQCSDCNSKYSFIRAEAYNALMKIPF